MPRHLTSLTHSELRTLIAADSPLDIPSQLDLLEELILTGLTPYQAYFQLAANWAKLYKSRDDRLRRLELDKERIDINQRHQEFISQPLSKRMWDNLEYARAFIEGGFVEQAYNFSRSLAHDGLELLKREH